MATRKRRYQPSRSSSQCAARCTTMICSYRWSGMFCQRLAGLLVIPPSTLSSDWLSRTPSMTRKLKAWPSTSQRWLCTTATLSRRDRLRWHSRRWHWQDTFWIALYPPTQRMLLSSVTTHSSSFRKRSKSHRSSCPANTLLLDTHVQLAYSTTSWHSKPPSQQHHKHQRHQCTTRRRSQSRSQARMGTSLRTLHPKSNHTHQSYNMAIQHRPSPLKTRHSSCHIKVRTFSLNMAHQHQHPTPPSNHSPATRTSHSSTPPTSPGSMNPSEVIHPRQDPPSLYRPVPPPPAWSPETTGHCHNM